MNCGPGSGGSTRSSRSVPSTWAASARASTPGEGTPAPVSTAVAAWTSSRRLARLPPPVFSPDPVNGSPSPGSVTAAGQPLGLVHLDRRGDHRAEVAVQHLVQVVGLVAGAVVGDPVLREVVGADPFAAVHSAHLGAAQLGGLRLGSLLLGGQQRSEEHTSELQSRGHLVCRLLLEKKTL